MKEITNYKIISSGCWEFQGAKNDLGYGYIRLGTKMIGAHRLSYMNKVNTSSIEGVVMHTCDNRSCVNPDHLILGTQSDNIKDMYKKNRGVNNKGSNHGQSKLTEEDVLKIRAMLSEGLRQSDIAIKFNVAQQTISDIKLNKLWSECK